MTAVKVKQYKRSIRQGPGNRSGAEPNFHCWDYADSYNPESVNRYFSRRHQKLRFAEKYSEPFEEQSEQNEVM